jgi:hypothetical protein
LAERIRWMNAVKRSRSVFMYRFRENMAVVATFLFDDILISFQGILLPANHDKHAVGLGQSYAGVRCARKGQVPAHNIADADNGTFVAGEVITTSDPADVSCSARLVPGVIKKSGVKTPLSKRVLLIGLCVTAPLPDFACRGRSLWRFWQS